MKSTSNGTARNLLSVLLCATVAPACAPHRMPPTAAQEVGVLKSDTVASWPVAPGSEVRVLAPALGDKMQVGVVASATQDTLFFRQEPQVSTRPIGVLDIRQLEIAQGTHKRSMRNAMIGFGLAALAGGAIGAAMTKTHPPCQPNTICLNLDGLDRSVNTMVGGLLGGAIGALIGAGSGAEEANWIPVPLPRAH